MQKIICLLGFVGLGWILYCMFQPVVDWNFGWESFPKNTFEQRFEGIEDINYEEAITSSQSIIDSIQKVSNSPSISIAAMIHGRMVWN